MAKTVRIPSTKPLTELEAIKLLGTYMSEAGKVLTERMTLNGGMDRFEREFDLGMPSVDDLIGGNFARIVELHAFVSAAHKARKARWAAASKEREKQRKAAKSDRPAKKAASAPKRSGKKVASTDAAVGG